ncbi:3921_t:CDS:2 [Funneliformis geosporum]|uniref:3921_t:CDS:1 n=1 Tax=Funneliformis geosporum TaxID=1117311 RepID=A0A9W4SE03_9GLOM|nr:3921_t:CDS:2 [Funneliformis geosporum]
MLSVVSYREYYEYVGLHHIKTNETPAEWKERIWKRLEYFRKQRFHVYFEEHAFYGSKLKIIDGSTIYQECGIAICFSCDQLVYLGFRRKKEYIDFREACQGMCQHWATHCTGNSFNTLNFSDCMEIQKRISHEEWKMVYNNILNVTKEYNKFKFRREIPYILICDNEFIRNEYGIFAGDILYRYLLWLENAKRRIKRILYSNL